MVSNPVYTQLQTLLVDNFSYLFVRHGCDLVWLTLSHLVLALPHLLGTDLLLDLCHHPLEVVVDLWHDVSLQLRVNHFKVFLQDRVDGLLNLVLDNFWQGCLHSFSYRLLNLYL